MSDVVRKCVMVRDEPHPKQKVNRPREVDPSINTLIGEMAFRSLVSGGLTMFRNTVPHWARRRRSSSTPAPRSFSVSWSDGRQLWPWEEEPAAAPRPELKTRVQRRREKNQRR
ncbi:MAG: hypothetical protein C7B46_02390 [Sulfobacillus benefaciens]|uniref:Uncharacterized protein n=1 Tax=Sulfobacillus benefaciens TaxID=453960 RepID=A0A2T2XKL7_9FIRM|nr:MAG: hypothetical protein C7B46_02390 [Sulfobacillus benefaciens]